MAVGAGAVAGAAHEGDDISLADVLAYADDNGGVVAVAGDDAAVVFDLDQVAVAGDPACLGDGAGRGGFDGRAVVAGNVDAFMIGGADAAGTLTEAEGAGDFSSYGPDIRGIGVCLYGRAAAV